MAAARRDMVDRLNHVLAQDQGAFPSAALDLIGHVDRWLAAMPAVDAEAALRQAYASARADTGDEDDGVPHRSDLAVTFVKPGHPSHGQAAALCSTGEQKALLVAIVLAHARLQAQRRGHAPLLLLDEVAAHLDAERRSALFKAVIELGAQAWMTGTDPETFRPLGDLAQHFGVQNGAFVPHPVGPSAGDI